MKRPRLMFVIMFWFFIDYAVVSRPLRDIAMQIGDVENIIRQLFLIIPFFIFVIIFGLFRLYIWSINTTLLIFILFFIMPLINIFNNGIANIQTGIMILIFQAFNIISIVYLLNTKNRKYFEDYKNEKDKEKKFKKIGQNIKL